MAVVTVDSNGKILLDGKEATAQELTDYLDYTKYTDSKKSDYVKGLLTNDTVSIDNVTYSTTLDKSGNLVSKDGSSSLNTDKIKEYFGEEGYAALIGKNTKDAKIEDGIITINNPVYVVGDSKEDTTNPTTGKDNKSGGSSSSGGGSSSSGSSSSGGGSSSGGSASSSGGESSSDASGTDTSVEDSTGEEESAEAEEAKFNTKTGQTDKIVVKFGQLENIITELKQLKVQYREIREAYSDNVQNINNDDETWSGGGKAAFKSQKTRYCGYVETIGSALLGFVECLNTCYEQYQEVEQKVVKEFGD